MKQGKMVPSRPLVELIRDKIKQMGNKYVYILDGNNFLIIIGFPRNNENLEAWEQVMKYDVDVKFLLYFECSEE
jgi:adenylate kinase family enzyme